MCPSSTTHTHKQTNTQKTISSSLVYLPYSLNDFEISPSLSPQSPCLTTLALETILLDVNVLLAALWAGAAAEEACPVDGVVVAQLLVSCDVDAAVVDPPQRAQPQRCQGRDAHHQQGVAPE